MKRSPILYACAIGLALRLGACARRYALAHQSLPADCAADVFWALSVFALPGLSFPTIPILQVTSGAFVIPAVLKLSQLHHAPWAGLIGVTHAGCLALGTESAATDLAFYALGAVVDMGIELPTLD